MSTLDIFYNNLVLRLLDSGVENDESIMGYAEEEIQVFEKQFEIDFPAAYKLFERKFGRNANFYDSSEYRLAYLSDAGEVMQEIVAESSIDFHGLFPFSQWQGYSVFCFNTSGENPEVILFVAGDEGVERYSYSSFTNWLLKQISIYLKYRQDKNDDSCKVRQLEKFIADSSTFAS